MHTSTCRILVAIAVVTVSACPDRATPGGVVGVTSTGDVWTGGNDATEAEEVARVDADAEATPPACTPESCDDGDPCTVDSCNDSGECVHQPKSCDDGDPCTVDSCPDSGECVHEPQVCDDGDPCTVDACDDSGECVHQPKACDDGDPCTADSCDAGGKCNSVPVSCDNGDPCTFDFCGSDGCVHAPKPCNDGDPCTDDTCDDGKCVHTLQTCDDGNICNGLETCKDGSCVDGEALDCGGTCLSGPCDPDYGCAVSTGTCGDPLAWAFEVIRWRGRPVGIMDVVGGQLSLAGCELACTVEWHVGLFCDAGDWKAETCTADGCLAAIGAIEHRHSGPLECTPFYYPSGIKKLTAEGFAVTVGGSTVQLDGVDSWSFGSDDAVAEAWDLDVTLTLSGDTVPGLPPWALPGVNSVTSAGSRYAAFALPPGSFRWCEGSASTEGQGRDWSVTWDLSWDPIDYMYEILGIPTGTCNIEPIGTVELTVTASDGTVTTQVLTYDGDVDCDGCAWLEDGTPAGCDELPF